MRFLGVTRLLIYLVIGLLTFAVGWGSLIVVVRDAVEHGNDDFWETRDAI